ncbi:SRPBCC family protein [Devosia nitrariae]|uniref:Activator of HSP90 ATPase n=1 Tax=Devosia nitrariae TaxID=2071872 RepID=A0ABQ5W9P3_9HYPH|nr:SRPBCC family protein [Devosia nitrariae]GLQ56825.1 activator of HSP90 ATPase [Devosia nitrariae]
MNRPMMSGTAGAHSSFTIERQLPGRPAHAYRFFAEPDLKRRWTECHPDWTVVDEAFDFRIGGNETTRLRRGDGAVQTVDIHYLDLLPGERIVYAYSMRLDETAVSASLVTIALVPEGTATRMLYTEHLAMLEGAGAAERQMGTEQGFDRLAAEIERALAN